jgi:hypothetical protein
MRHTIVTALSLLAVSASAAPRINTRFGRFPSQQAAASQSFTTSLTATGCSLNSVQLDLSNTTLPAPPSGQKLLFVGAGRGTQNYTCDTYNPSSAPVAVGAVATLYDAGCVAANYPQIFNAVPDILLQFSGLSPSPSTVLAFSDSNVLAHHYFSDSTTPVFDLGSTGGLVVAKKIDACNAPAGSPAGQASTATGAVPWLFLQSQSGTTGNVKSVYRVSTAGGMQPSTCTNQAAAFTVEYAAKYLFYG